MGLFANLFAKPVSGAVVESLGAAGTLAKDIRTAITGQTPVDPVKVMELENQLLTAQAEVNKAEAGHASIFVAGWRPLCGYTCTIALAYHFIIGPLVEGIFGVAMPVVDVGELYPILGGMLGLAGLRTWEKAKGVNERHG